MKDLKQIFQSKNAVFLKSSKKIILQFFIKLLTAMLNLN